jgi:hypothetical protein|uniref:Uncharacterized protein n=2 Tax=viral metagenome TaxID=1070528 RepID=A0A6C0INW8_9ZZZZ
MSGHEVGSEEYNRELMNSPITEAGPEYYGLKNVRRGQLRAIQPGDLTGESVAYLRSITDSDDIFRDAGRTSPHAEQSVGPLGTSPKKSKARKVAAKSKKKGGKRKSRRKSRKKKNFKKHYMWNTRGKRYFAKTYKQHRRGVKLGHSHKKPKKKSRKRRR